MKKLLLIESGINKNASQTRSMSKQFIDKWQQQNPESVIVSRDLISPLMPHLDDTTVAGFFTPPEQHSAATKAAIQFSDELVEEFLEADAIVIGAPVYNLSIPSTLKAYFDHISRVGKTFQYTETGVQGLVSDKPVFIITARGGFAEPAQNFHQQYLQQFFNFLGITKIEFIQAEGLALDEATKEKMMEKIQEQMESLTAA